MMSNLLKMGSVLAIVCLVGCGESSGGNGGNNTNSPTKKAPINRVNWSTVPSEYNPGTDHMEFPTDGFVRINIDAFGFKDDVEVIYTNDVPANSAYLKLYKVFKDSASWGSFRSHANGTTLDLNNYGSYQCSIRITNGQIADLKGGCYVRLQVLLPIGSEIEVHNVGQLITKRFIPINAEDFLEQIDDAIWAADKFAVIEIYLASYNGMTKRPSLNAQQLGVVIGEFSFKEEKFKALGRIHSVVSDRENLGKMIEDKFGYFEQEEARRIIGL